MFSSLRFRVAITAVLSVSVSAILILLTMALTIGPVSQRTQENKARQILSRAAVLEGTVATEKLADRLTEPGFSVVITRDGTDYVPTGSATIIRTVDSDSNYITMRETLPKTGATVTVATLNLGTFDILGQIMKIAIPTILVVLIILVLALGRVTRLALRPLNRMTDLALRIANGERGRRLEAKDPRSELGRTAIAFDTMLDSLETNLTRAELAESRLRQLCADVAHELRSPISSMVAAADNLMRDLSLENRNLQGTRQAAEDTAIAVVREGRRASRIVGDLTLAAQLDVAELADREVVKSKSDLNAVLRHTIDDFAFGEDVSVTSVVPSSQTVANVDAERIQQIVNNLLSNAARWAKSRIEINVAETEGFWSVTVADDGPGIPVGEREHIFERFVRLDADRARNKGGAGLGLAISKALAKAHDGTLRCLENSDSLGGACFELRLPIKG